MYNIPVVILCGGKGTRLKEETEFKPKSLVEIGGIPILIHIMDIYVSQGFKEFILCLGYKGNLIKKYFLEHKYLINDFTIDVASNRVEFHNKKPILNNCKITFVDTGEETLTAGRIKKIQKYVGKQDFMLTYGDGVGNIDLNKLVEFHRRNGKICTLTGVNPVSKYGLIKLNENQEVLDFAEKPLMEDTINAGFMIIKPEFFNYIEEDCMFESVVLPKLSELREVCVYLHKGFWHCMDTYKDYKDLNTLWKESKPWKINPINHQNEFIQ